MPPPTACRWLLVLLALAVPLTAGAGDLQVWLVRHAEKAVGPPGDPALSAAGLARAQALAQALGEAGIGAVYVSQYRRTQATAEPLAAAAGIEPRVRPASGEVEADARAFASMLRATHAGQAVLVVGHSNTVPAIAAALLGGSTLVAAMDEEEYDRLLLVTVPAGGTAPRLASLRYGSPPP